VSGTNLNAAVFNGVRFELTKSVFTNGIGGHFVGSPSGNGDYFGAIVRLDGPNDFPNSANLTSSDVLGTTLIHFPDPSAEAFGNIELPLDPGWYGLVFGTDNG
jgi:hypothetical protein